MNKEKMKELFQQAMNFAYNNNKHTNNNYIADVALYKFGELVEKEAVKSEREGCAKTVETFGTWDMTDRFAAAIRARE